MTVKQAVLIDNEEECSTETGIHILYPIHLKRLHLLQSNNEDMASFFCSFF